MLLEDESDGSNPESGHDAAILACENWRSCRFQILVVLVFKSNSTNI